ncbi:50S ribosomal protein L7/L12 [bacterium HR35]|nr:50S ribosomal protein L7/L12 [bacterium HR35]
MSDKIQQIIQMIENLTVVELNELVKALEEKFGVSAAAFVAAAPVQAPAQAETQTGGTVEVVLVDAGANKINVIKVLRELNPNMSLKDAKDAVDNPPYKVASGIERAKAEEIKKKFEQAGAKVEIK